MNPDTNNLDNQTPLNDSNSLNQVQSNDSPSQDNLIETRPVMEAINDNNESISNENLSSQNNLNTDSQHQLEPIDNPVVEPINPSSEIVSENSDDSFGVEQAPLPEVEEDAMLAVPLSQMANELEVVDNGMKIGGVPSTEKRSKRSFLKYGLVGLVSVFILVLGSAGAYFGYILPNKPVNVLSQAVVNSLNSSQYSVNANMNITSSGTPINVGLKLLTDRVKQTASVNLNVSLLGSQYLNFSGIEYNHNFFVNLGDLSTVANLLGKLDPSANALSGTISAQLSNKWIELSKTVFDNSSLSCLSNSGTLLSGNDINLFINDYKQNQFMSVSGTSNTLVNTIPSEEFQTQINNDKVISFLNSGLLSKTALFGNSSSCGSSSTSSISNNLKGNNKTTNLAIWMDKSNNKINQIQYSNNSSTNLKLLVNFSYGQVNINAPQTFMTPTQFNQLLKTDLSNPATGSLLLGLVSGLQSNLSSLKNQ